MGRLAGKNIFITGGNSGIGLAAAQEFDREGARVAICGLNEASLQAAKETLGPGSLAVHADVSNLTDLDTMFATIKREFGHLDGVFVNAGYSVFLPFEEMTEQNFDRVIAVNFKGAYFTIQKALPHCEKDYRQKRKLLPFRKLQPPRDFEGFHIASHPLPSLLHHVLFLATY